MAQLLNGPPGVFEGFDLPFHSPTPSVLESCPLAFPFWRPVQGCAGDAALLSPYDMSHPSPSPSLAYGLYVLLATSGEKLVVRDGLRPENAQGP